VSVVVTSTAAEVRHGHEDTGGSRDKPKGSLIKSFPFSKYGRKEAIKKAHAMHYAIIKSEERRKDHDEGAGNPVGVAPAMVPVALRNTSIQYKNRNFSEPGMPWKKEIGRTSDDWVIYTVQGQYIRNNYDCDFTEGGHFAVYPWVPENEIWIEAEQSKEDIELSTFHEVYECKLMTLTGMDYDSAHDETIEVEKAAREAGKLALIKNE